MFVWQSLNFEIFAKAGLLGGGTTFPLHITSSWEYASILELVGVESKVLHFDQVQTK